MDTIQTTGKNTAWAKGHGADASIPRYSARKAYMQDNHADHSFPKSIMHRHVQSQAADDKRGLSCAEGHSVIESHTRLKTAGQQFAHENLENFKLSLVPMPSFSKNTKSAHKRQMLAKRDAALNSILESTGMKSWEEYASKEASFMAWNDIQRHGKISDVRHDEHSDVSAGHDMDYCTNCRTEIVKRMENMKDK